jgi:hypothetical protein
MDDDERDGHSGAAALRRLEPVEAEAIRAEGLDPDDPAVQAALDFVRCDLELNQLSEEEPQFRLPSSPGPSP